MTSWDGRMGSPAGADRAGDRAGERPAVSVEEQVRAGQFTAALDLAACQGDLELLRRAARHKFLPEAACEVLLNTFDLDVLDGLAVNPRTSAAVLQVLTACTRAGSEVRTAVYRHYVDAGHPDAAECCDEKLSQLSSRAAVMLESVFADRTPPVAGTAGRGF